MSLPDTPYGRICGEVNCKLQITTPHARPCSLSGKDKRTSALILNGYEAQQISTNSPFLVGLLQLSRCLLFCHFCSHLGSQLCCLKSCCCCLITWLVDVTRNRLCLEGLLRYTTHISATNKSTLVKEDWSAVPPTMYGWIYKCIVSPLSLFHNKAHRLLSVNWHRTALIKEYLGGSMVEKHLGKQKEGDRMPRCWADCQADLYKRSKSVPGTC